MNLTKRIPAGLLFAVLAAQGAAFAQRIQNARARAFGEYTPSRPGRRFGTKKDGTWRGRWIGSMKVSHIGRR